jgi:hypothetical protein
MRLALVVCSVLIVSACGGSSTTPTAISAGNTTSVAGTWDGTITSSNNASVQVTMVLAQSGSDVTGTWRSTAVAWSGDITGTVSASTFNGQFKFSGTAADGTVCTGAAAVSGPVTSSTLTWTSANGVVGGACPAPLPVGIKIDVQRQ